MFLKPLLKGQLIKPILTMPKSRSIVPTTGSLYEISLVYLKVTYIHAASYGFLHLLFVWCISLQSSKNIRNPYIRGFHIQNIGGKLDIYTHIYNCKFRSFFFVVFKEIVYFYKCLTFR